MKFWRKAPPPAWRDIRALSLLVPACAATLGGIAYSIQGIAATQAGVMPEAWVDVAVSVGGVLLAVGCEGGTLSAMAEIARKRRDGDSGPVDRWAGWVSFLATVFARLLALVSLRATWSIVLLVILSAADVYALISEAGEYLALADRNMVRWLTARHYYETLGDIAGAQAALRGDAVMPRLTEPALVTDSVTNVVQFASGNTPAEARTPAQTTTPTRADWLAYARGLNGRRATVTAADAEAWLTAQGAPLPSKRTLQHWAKEAREVR